MYLSGKIIAPCRISYEHLKSLNVIRDSSDAIDNFSTFSENFHLQNPIMGFDLVSRVFFDPESLPYDFDEIFELIQKEWDEKANKFGEDIDKPFSVQCFAKPDKTEIMLNFKIFSF